MIADLYRFGRELKQWRNVEASKVLHEAGDPLLREVGPLLLQPGGGSDARETVVTLSYARLAQVKSAEEVFRFLARTTPAVGLMGTIVGLVNMLMNLKNFEQLGPAMAVAQLATFYGLILAYGLWAPFAKRIENYGRNLSVSASAPVPEPYLQRPTLRGSCIGQVGEQLVTLLTAMSEDVDKPVGELSMISDDEAQRTLVTWNRTQTSTPGTRPCTNSSRCRRRPPGCTGGPLPWGDLQLWAAEREGQSTGPSPTRLGCRTRPVGGLLSRSLARNGGHADGHIEVGPGYVPLDPNYPIERLELMLKSSQAPTLMTQQRLLPQFLGLVSRSICLDLEADPGRIGRGPIWTWRSASRTLPTCSTPRAPPACQRGSSYRIGSL